MSYHKCFDNKETSPNKPNVQINSVYLGRFLMLQKGGKPSTWFPLVGLVELYALRSDFPNMFLFDLFFGTSKTNLAKLTPS